MIAIILVTSVYSNVKLLLLGKPFFDRACANANSRSVPDLALVLRFGNRAKLVLSRHRLSAGPEGSTNHVRV